MNDLYEPYKEALGDFIRDEKGRAEYFRIGGRAHKNYRIIMSFA